MCPRFQVFFDRGLVSLFQGLFAFPFGSEEVNNFLKIFEIFSNFQLSSLKEAVRQFDTFS